jgi:hypothetical protein
LARKNTTFPQMWQATSRLRPLSSCMSMAAGSRAHRVRPDHDVIGAAPDRGNSVWGKSSQVWIDEVRVYSQALSASEIQADMTTPFK